MTTLKNNRHCLRSWVISGTFQSYRAHCIRETHLRSILYFILFYLVMDTPSGQRSKLYHGLSLVISLKMLHCELKRDEKTN